MLVRPTCNPSHPHDRPTHVLTTSPAFMLRARLLLLPPFTAALHILDISTSVKTCTHSSMISSAGHALSGLCADGAGRATHLCSSAADRALMQDQNSPKQPASSVAAAMDHCSQPVTIPEPKILPFRCVGTNQHMGVHKFGKHRANWLDVS